MLKANWYNPCHFQVNHSYRKQEKMQPLGKLRKDELLDALTYYYDRSREIVEGAGNEKEYISCRLKIDSILRELQDRRTSDSPADRYNGRSSISNRSSE